MTEAQAADARVGPMPRIGFGTWQRDGEEAVRTVGWALAAGFRLIDTAEAYGNETEVGRAIAASGVPRDEVFVTTKVAPPHLGRGQVRPHVEASLERLATGYADLVLIYWPAVDGAFEMADYLGQLADVRDAGLARHIGVSNFTCAQIDRACEILGAGAIATNQVEVHPFLQNRTLARHCRQAGIPLTAYAPVARGAVAEAAAVRRIAEAHGATPGQVALAFLLAEGHAVIPTSRRRERIAENLAAGDLRLSDDDISALRALDRGERLVDPDWAPAWDD